MARHRALYTGTHLKNVHLIHLTSKVTKLRKNQVVNPRSHSSCVILYPNLSDFKSYKVIHNPFNPSAPRLPLRLLLPSQTSSKDPIYSINCLYGATEVNQRLMSLSIRRKVPLELHAKAKHMPLVITCSVSQLMYGNFKNSSRTFVTIFQGPS